MKLLTLDSQRALTSLELVVVRKYYLSRSRVAIVLWHMLEKAASTSNSFTNTRNSSGQENGR
jgi:hypothetical protein